MKLKTWTCGLFAGILATIVLTAISMTMYISELIPLSITEYAARFILYLDGKEMNTGRWIVGFLTNFSLGGLFGILSAYLYKKTGPDEKYVKIGAIAVGCWFFQLAIVPYLSKEVANYSVVITAITYYIIYILWSLVASYFILKYLDFTK